jgi:hypothetical protein
MQRILIGQLCFLSNIHVFFKCAFVMSIGTAVAYVGRLFQFQTTVGFILVTVIVALLAESAAIDKSPIDTFVT